MTRWIWLAAGHWTFDNEISCLFQLIYLEVTCNSKKHFLLAKANAQPFLQDILWIQVQVNWAPLLSLWVPPALLIHQNRVLHRAPWILLHLCNLETRCSRPKSGKFPIADHVCHEVKWLTWFSKVPWIPKETARTRRTCLSISACFSRWSLETYTCIVFLKPNDKCDDNCYLLIYFMAASMIFGCLSAWILHTLPYPTKHEGKKWLDIGRKTPWAPALPGLPLAPLRPGGPGVPS